MAKSVFQVHAIDASGRVILNKAVRRAGFVALLARFPKCLIGMEACASSHHWARTLMAMGAQHTLENIGSLGEGRATSGAVFVADIVGGRLAGPPRRASTDADLAWPVIGVDGRVFALQAGHLVRLTPAGAAQPAGAGAEIWRKLVGVGEGGVVAGLLAEPPPFGRPALLAPGGAFQAGAPPATPEDRRRQGVLLQESQALEGGRALRVARSARGGRGFDVFYAQPGAERLDVSDCGDDSCGQPSMAPDGSKVVYIRQSR